MGKSITGKSRMEAAFGGGKLDRQPVLLILGGHYAERAGYSLEEFFTQSEAALETTKVTCQELDSDALFVPLNPLMPDAQEAFRKLMGKPLSIKKENIKEKLPKWSVRLPREDPLFSGHLDMCEKCVAVFPDYQINTMIGGPWSFALELRGANEAMEDLYDDKQFLHDLMKYTTGTVIARCLAVLDLGVVPFIGDPSAGMSLISPAVYREHVLPFHKEIVEAVHDKGGLVSFHICGYIDPIFQDLIDLGIDGLSIDGPSSLEKLFDMGRGKTTIIGNIDPMLFVEGTPDQLEEEVRKCLDIAGGEARYVIGPGCQIPLQANLDNIRVFTQACHKYGAF
ncbi:MAG: uroporphyrinogen decarboxylase family protein [Deltaproteobacteria bacterium]|uniref:Uroporphyrinogen decarboxylase family protein n=1 Tax=Candidatus Desulfacyla euxinica TaxID=2841693 RepID=A0A8J6N2K7_9DELT|nr:uroporphyrinogen decarboxylase family protein [Candidatus Desulfacyla euxinica]